MVNINVIYIRVLMSETYIFVPIITTKYCLLIVPYGYNNY